MARVGAYTLARDACRRSHVRPSCSVTSDVDDVAFPTSTSNMRAYARLAEWALRIQPRAPHNSLYRHVYTQCCVHSYTCIVGTRRWRVLCFEAATSRRITASPLPPLPRVIIIWRHAARNGKKIIVGTISDGLGRRPTRSSLPSSYFPSIYQN